MSLLSAKQKAEVAVAAGVAWGRCPERAALLAGNPELAASAVAAGWRRVEQGKVLGAGRQSLTQARQDEFPRLMAHFTRLAGLDGVAEHWEGRALSDGRRRARWLLEQACKGAGVDVSYAARIFWVQARRGLDEANETELWRLVYTVRNRKKAG